MKVDAKISLNWDDPEEREVFLSGLRQAGFRAACVEIPRNQTPNKLKTFLTSSPVRLYSRKTLQPRNKDDLLRLLQKIAPNYDYFSVYSEDPEVLELAARDSRVGVISLTNEGRVLKLTPGIASLVKQGNMAFEFLLGSILDYKGFSRTKYFRKVANNIRVISLSQTPLIFGSEARGFYDILAPMHFIALAKEVFGIPIHFAKSAISQNAFSVIEANHLRQSPDYIMEGVRIVSENEGGKQDR